MAIVLLPVLAGALTGWVRGGRIQALERLRLRAPWLVGAAVGVQLVLHRFGTGWRLPLLFASYALVGLWLARNVGGRRAALRAGLAMIAAGWAMNLAAMVPNGGMPVSESALDVIGVAPGYDVADGHLSKHVGGHGGLVDGLLGDSIPVAPLGAVISLGDIVLAAGIAVTLATAMTDRRPVGDERELKAVPA